MHASARWTVTALLAIAAVLCVLALAGCGGSTSTPTTGGVAGVATWSNGSGAAYVHIRFTGTSAIYNTDSADGSGAYSVSEPMLPGEYAVSSWVPPGPAAPIPGNGRWVTPRTITITAGQTANQPLSIDLP